MNLLNTILTSHFLIEEQAAHSYLPFVFNLAQGKFNTKLIQKKRALTLDSFARVNETSGVSTVGWVGDANQKDTVYVARLHGEVMKYGTMCGPNGTLTLQQKIQDAKENQFVSAIVLSIDTPGGEVSGTDLLADVIKNSEKPVVVFGSGMVCSAGVWIASGADYIFSSSKLDKWGSVGTMVMFADFTKHYENQGVKIHEIYATLSKDKNADYKNLLEGKYDDYRKEKLDVINGHFHAFVKENRNLPDAAITGKTFLGDEAKKLGFFDEYGTLQDAILKAHELSKSKNKTISKKTIYVG